MSSDESLSWMRVTFEQEESEEREEDELQERHQYLDYSNEMEESL